MSEHHAKLSPSGASRWMACPGSVVLEAEYPDRGSVYADEGTAAHTLAALCLQGSVDCDDFMGEFITVGQRRFEVTEDMIGHVQRYVDYVRERAHGNMLMVEQRVPIGHITGEENAHGTADAIIIDADAREIVVIDLKYGMGVEVDAEENEQAQMYALGALEECSVIADFDTVVMVIYQPRIRKEPSVWRISVKDIQRFAEQAAAASDNVRAANTKARRESSIDPTRTSKEELLKHGWTKEEAAQGFLAGSPADRAQWDEAYLSPGEKQCKFCRAKASCPALRNEMFELVGAPSASAEDFAQFVPDAVDAETGDNWLSAMMSKVELFEGLLKAVRAETERRLLSGGTVDGFKLVQGRQGPRKWRDEKEAEALLKGFRLKIDEMYDKSLISPTSAEKLLKADAKRWAKVEAAITRSDGKPSVAPVSDKRPAMSVTATAADFADLVTTDD